MPGAQVPLIRRAQAAAAADLGLQPAMMEALIASVDSAGAVQRVGALYSIDLEILAQVAPANISLVTAAVQRANSDPLSNPPVVAAAAAAAAPSTVDEINKVGAALQKAPSIVSDIQSVIAATTVTAHWWGPTVIMTHAAATALTNVTTGDMLAVLGGISVFIPSAAAVIAMIVAAGAALSVWVKAADHGNGVQVKLYMWVVPWVSGI